MASQHYGKIRILWLIVLALFLLLTGCAQAPQTGQPGGPAPAVVTVWHSLQGAESDALQGQVQAIMKAHPEVIIELKYVPEQSFVSLSYQAEAGGEGPDIFIASREDLRQLYGQGLLAKVVYQDADSFPAALANFRFGGEGYALPWLTDVPMLYFRTDTAAAPVNLDDLFSAKGGVSLAAANTATLSTWWNGQGGRLTNAGKPSLVDPNNITFLQQLANWQGTGVLHIDPNFLASFTSGQSPYIIAGASQAKLLTQQNVPWGSIPLNDLVGGQGQALLGTTLGIANSEIKTQGALAPALKVVEQSLLAPGVEGALYQADGLLPANKGFYSRPEAQKGVFPQAYRALIKAWALDGNAPEWKLIPLQDTAWSDALAGSAQPADALTSAQGQAGQALNSHS